MKKSFAFPNLLRLNYDFLSQLSLHFFPVLADRNSIVWENVIHTRQKALGIKIWVEFSCDYFFVHRLRSFLQSLRHLLSDLLSFDLQHVHWNVFSFEILGRSTQNLSCNVISEFSNDFNFALLIFLWKAFRYDCFHETSLHADSILISLVNVNSESPVVGMQSNDSSDSDVFLQPWNHDFEFFECVWWIPVFWEHVKRRLLL